LIELELWQSGDDIDEASVRGVIAARKFWQKGIEKACVELGGHNFDRWYRYQMLICIDSQDRVKDAIRKVIRYGPGDIKWVNLLLYKGDEKSVYEELENKVGDLNDLKASLRRNDKKAKELATKLAREHLKSKMDSGKEVIPEYEPIINLLMQGNGDKAVVCLIGYNFQADKVVKNGCKDFNWLGKVVGLNVDDIRKATLIEIEEEEDAYFVELGVVS